MFRISLFPCVIILERNISDLKTGLFEAQGFFVASNPAHLNLLWHVPFSAAQLPNMKAEPFILISREWIQC